mmetsp:Transcript_24053/g.74482  ORF Transcript_24053/g.74482 Transcript_24053/m.74482 type:complete len:222 (-) Transcript_24053:187-852(-)
MASATQSEGSRRLSSAATRKTAQAVSWLRAAAAARRARASTSVAAPVPDADGCIATAATASRGAVPSAAATPTRSPAVGWSLLLVSADSDAAQLVAPGELATGLGMDFAVAQSVSGDEFTTEFDNSSGIQSSGFPWRPRAVLKAQRNTTRTRADASPARVRAAIQPRATAGVIERLCRLRRATAARHDVAVCSSLLAATHSAGEPRSQGRRISPAAPAGAT